jgi:hypothetical protein
VLAVGLVLRGPHRRPTAPTAPVSTADALPDPLGRLS